VTVLTQQTARLLVVDACGLSKVAYDKLVKDWDEMIGNPGIYAVSIDTGFNCLLLT
jgi:hypothetical protein